MAWTETTKEEALKKRNMLIFDLGSGTFDVSNQNIQDDTFEVKSTAGNTYLSGENFDKLMGEFKCKYENDTASNKRAACASRLLLRRQNVPCFFS